MSTPDAIRERLQALAPSHLQITDDSARHAGHAGAKSGGHYHVTIVAAAFAGLPTMRRHRLVYDALGPLMRGAIHALGIDARAPEEN